MYKKAKKGHISNIKLKGVSMKITTIIAFILVLIGAIVWLLVGLFDFNLVTAIFGVGSVIARIIFTLVGIAGLWMIFYWAIYRPFSQM